MTPRVVRDPEQFDRSNAASPRATRPPTSRAPGRRPGTRHLVARLAVLGVYSHCGERMHALTAAWRRADGSRARHYKCPNVHGSTGTSHAPKVDAEVVEPYFIEHLHDFVFDLDAWVTARRRDRERTDEAIRRDLSELGRLDRLPEKVRADYLRRLEAAEQDAADVASASMRDVDESAGRWSAESQSKRKRLPRSRTRRPSTPSSTCTTS